MRRNKKPPVACAAEGCIKGGKLSYPNSIALRGFTLSILMAISILMFIPKCSCLI